MYKDVMELGAGPQQAQQHTSRHVIQWGVPTYQAADVCMQMSP